MKILITGGAGFIGSRLVESLFEKGHDLRVIDNLSPQIHGDDPFNSDLFAKIQGKCDFHHQDIAKISDWERFLADVDVLVHLAAETGTGQSMYEIGKYNLVNCQATANIADFIVNNKTKLKNVIVSSSRAVYGEGKYKCLEHGIHYPGARRVSDMERAIFEPLCPVCDSELQMIPTTEESPVSPASIYGLSKYNQEQTLLIACSSIGINTISLRYQNVYGPGQSLSNPYTGILSIFSNRILDGKDINIFEDGLESRDFVYIEDVVQATESAIYNSNGYTGIINVGTGVKTSVLDVLSHLQSNYEKESDFTISGDFRVGDIRHNVADITLLKEKLNFIPKVSFSEGIEKFCKWVSAQNRGVDNYEDSLSEMKDKGLLK
ncbi:NAD-dependent epimerase [Vibrio ishigakensis]|uniref:NAD-dependent epimerase n=1 Tax=Vibrio ishigakensis TaxID=1481914 RepID=A0A0B8P9F8_9VIBR|nr:NAD-dependent epimerase/dehydratase family protein [Vibrio ishigakensis]GAM59554.1 NAD-dependent epimerase [Vibrio ishigakensis]